ncbi:MAG: hypothetical protein ABIK62_06355 [candidate division WOR-3 bacterium]
MRTCLLFCLCVGARVVFGAWRAVGPDGGNIAVLATSPDRPEVLYAVPYENSTSARLFRSLDHGRSWYFIATIPEELITRLAVDPHDSDLLYALGRGTVLYRSTNQGQDWMRVTLPGTAAALATDPLLPGYLYLAGYYNYSGAYRAAAYVSSDYGLTWEVSMPEPETTGYAEAVIASPLDSGMVFLGATYGRLYRSDDACRTWVRLSNGIPAGSAVQALSVNPQDGMFVLAGLSNGLFRSTDQGESWARVGEMTTVLDVAFGQGGDLAYCLGQGDSMRFWASVDSGGTWHAPRPGYAGSKSARILADPREPHVCWLFDERGIYNSQDTGAHWRAANSGLRLAHISCISVSPCDQNCLYIEVAENGVFKTLSAGDSWSRCSDFLSCGSICGIGISGAFGQEVVYALEGSG